MKLKTLLFCTIAAPVVDKKYPWMCFPKKQQLFCLLFSSLIVTNKHKEQIIWNIIEKECEQSNRSETDHKSKRKSLIVIVLTKTRPKKVNIQTETKGNKSWWEPYLFVQSTTFNWLSADPTHDFTAFPLFFTKK